jgi:metal-responsive CopG/Arc/MetJ family transcriptional regulator
MKKITKEYLQKKNSLICDICGKPYKTYSGLNMHRHWNHGEQPSIVGKTPYKQRSFYLPRWIYDEIDKDFEGYGLKSMFVRELMEDFLTKEESRQTTKKGFINITFNLYPKHLERINKLLKTGRYMNGSHLLRVALYEYYNEIGFPKKEKIENGYLERNDIKVIREA